LGYRSKAIIAKVQGPRFGNVGGRRQAYAVDENLLGVNGVVPSLGWSQSKIGFIPPIKS